MGGPMIRGPGEVMRKIMWLGREGLHCWSTQYEMHAFQPFERYRNPDRVTVEIAADIMSSAIKPIIGVETYIARRADKRSIERLMPFERYGFNKAHATCYGLIAYQTAYLKANCAFDYRTATAVSDVTNLPTVAHVHVLAPLPPSSRPAKGFDSLATTRSGVYIAGLRAVLYLRT
jgi:hypothetical protein